MGFRVGRDPNQTGGVNRANQTPQEQKPQKTGMMGKIGAFVSSIFSRNKGENMEISAPTNFRNTETPTVRQLKSEGKVLEAAQLAMKATKPLPPIPGFKPQADIPPDVKKYLESTQTNHKTAAPNPWDSNETIDRVLVEWYDQPTEQYGPLPEGSQRMRGSQELTDQQRAQIDKDAVGLTRVDVQSIDDEPQAVLTEKQVLGEMMNLRDDIVAIDKALSGKDENLPNALKSIRSGGNIENTNNLQKLREDLTSLRRELNDKLEELPKNLNELNAHKGAAKRKTTYGQLKADDDKTVAPKGPFSRRKAASPSRPKYDGTYRPPPPPPPGVEPFRGPN